MADEETTERDQLEKWRTDCENATLKLKSDLLFHTFEKMNASAFGELEYAESLWHHVNQLDGLVQELEQLMQEHVRPLREKAGVVEPRKHEASNG